MPVLAKLILIVNIQEVKMLDSNISPLIKHCEKEYAKLEDYVKLTSKYEVNAINVFNTNDNKYL